MTKQTPVLFLGMLSTCLCFGDSSSIISRSPFVPSNFNPNAQTAPVDVPSAVETGYEFRGVYQIGDRYWFLVSEPKSREGNWIELGKEAEDLLAQHYDPETKSLTVSSNNTQYTLALAEVEANPVPIPVKGLVKTSTRTPTKTPTPVRRTVGPTSGRPQGMQPQGNKGGSTPTPAWLEQLRKEAAERRARGGGGQGGPDGGPGGQSAMSSDARRRVITPNRPSSSGQPQGGSGGKGKPSKSR